MTNPFEQMVAFSDRDDQAHEPVTQQQFEHWQQKQVTFDALHGLRYGQSFCNRFGVSDNLLYYTTWPLEQLTEYIRKHYIENN